MLSEAGVYELEARFYEAGPAMARANADLNQCATDSHITKDLSEIGNALSHLLELYEGIENAPVPGQELQKIESDLDRLLQLANRVLETMRAQQLDQKSATSSSYSTISSAIERLKDFWVAFSSSIDPNLSGKLKTAEAEESVSWDSLWR